MHFIRGVVVARKKRGLSQKDLAEKAGISQSYLTQVEKSIDPKRKTKEISSQIMFKMASVLECTIDLLIFYGNHYDYYMGLPASSK